MGADVDTNEASAVDSDSKSLLVFAIDSQFFAINAASVVSVIGWREPVALPGSHSTIRGVIQDRGRVVVVIEHPLAGGATAVSTSETPARILICDTVQGYVGIPATHTFSIEAHVSAVAVEDGALIEMRRGPVFIVDADVVAERAAGVQEGAL